MNSSNIIIIVLLILILIPAVKGAVTHMKGEGGCCGGPKEKAPRKKLPGKPVRRLRLGIEGMHCDNCRIRIEKHLDEIDCVTARVNLAKKQAIVSIYGDVTDDIIKETVENLDFTVTDVETI